MVTETDNPITQQQFLTALNAPLPRFYLNGFVFGQSLADIAMVMQLNGAPIAVMNMSFTTAKSLSEDLANLVSQFEKAMNHQVMTMAEIQSKTGAEP